MLPTVSSPCWRTRAGRLRGEPGLAYDGPRRSSMMRCSSSSEPSSSTPQTRLYLKLCLCRAANRGLPSMNWILSFVECCDRLLSKSVLEKNKIIATASRPAYKRSQQMGNDKAQSIGVADSQPGYRERR